ncbi:hypothetical protein FJTKL_15375 [Diaporthe vaccinii]|uniref:Uncharacterized protein n=1 Tax=Diaporthe vaccinii TaxID=105482 RepID=A0ABR4E537_9PEZI
MNGLVLNGRLIIFGVKFSSLCIGCANSAASGKSSGNCLDAEADDGNRCTRYDRGGNVCFDIPLVLVPTALHLCALRKALPKGYENTKALNNAIQAWKISRELYVSGAYDDLVVRAREDGDPEPVQIPVSIRKPIQKRALKNAETNTPTKKRARTDKSAKSPFSSDSSESESEENGPPEGDEYSGSEEDGSVDELGQ